MSPNPNESPQGAYPPPPAPSAYPPPQGEYAPPQGAYPPPSAQGASPSSVSATFNLQDLLKRYRTVLTHPHVATFDAELPAANWQAVWIGVGILALAWTVLAFLANLVSSGAYGSSFTIGGAIGVFAVFFFGYFVIVGVYQLIARLFGGTASFLTYAYALSLVVVPIDVIAGVALIIPLLGVLVMLGVSLYGTYLMVLATQSAQRVTPGKAWAIVLIPAAAALVLSCLLTTVFGILLFAAFNSAH